MPTQLAALPDAEKKSLEKLGMRGDPIYYAKYADGCVTCKTDTGDQYWEGDHAPHNQFVKDEPIEIWQA